MDRRWQTSDAFYDLRASSTPERLNDQLEELADQPITCIDDDYLNFHRLLTGQPARINPANADPREGNLRNDDNDETQEKRIQYTEMDPEYAVLVANTPSFECNITGKENGDLNIEGDRDIPPLVVTPRSLEDDAMHDNEVQDRQARNVENGRELRDYLSDDLGLGEAAHRRVRRMNVRPRLCSVPRKDLREDDAVRVPMRRRKFAELENETETMKRKLSDASDGYNKVEVENALESFKRNYNEVKQINKIAVKLKNAMKEEAKKLMLSLKDISEECSTAEEQDTDPDDVEVLNQVAMEQQTPTEKHLTAGDDAAQPIEAAAAVEFRRRLLSVLNKPFDKEEYAELWKLFKDGAHRRSYPDVRKILTEHRYKREKRLNVLRGFFFWFENNTQIGSFEPWKDNECLAI